MPAKSSKKKQAEAESAASKPRQVHATNRALLRYAVDITKRSRAKMLFVYLDAFEPLPPAEAFPNGVPITLITKNVHHRLGELYPHHKVLVLPDLRLGRMGMVKMALVLAMSARLITSEDTVVFLSGKSDFGRQDMIFIFTLQEESELFSGHSFSVLPDIIQPEVFEQTLNLAIELASKGREGKPVGTSFVIGDEDKVMQLSKQMIINPFKGYAPEERHLLSPQLKETIREFSSLDGAFIISGQGEVLSAGRYLSAAMDGADLPRGLGSRHIAASGITALTNAVAIVISESTGDVRIFKDGQMITTIEKPSRN